MLKIGLLALLRCHDLGDDVNPSSGREAKVPAFLLLAVWWLITIA